MESYGENRMVLPTNVNVADRNRPRNIVYYGRVSTEHEAQLSALHNQLQWYDDQTKYHSNWTVLRKYIDEGITGTQAKKRPAFLEMLADAKERKFDLIVTREVCRFARNTVDTLTVTRELKNYGIEVYFVEDNIWTMDGDGELRLTIMATLAQEESRKTSERVRAGQKISRDNGVLYGNGNILGYDRVGDTYVINEEQAETVRLIYNLYAQGLGFKKIVAELVQRQRKDSYGLVRWECTKISRILHNATYKGYKGYLKSFRNNFLEQKSIINRDEKTHLYIKGDFEPIISEELWEKCKQIRESKQCEVKRRFGGGVTGYNSSSDVWVHKLKCRCGSSMKRNKWRVNLNGEIIYGYKCYNQLNNGSKKLRVKSGVASEGYCDLSEICDWKLELIAKKIFSSLRCDYKAAMIDAYHIYNSCYETDRLQVVEQREDWLNKLEKAKNKLANLTNMRIEGEISKAEYQEYKQKVSIEISEIEKALLNFENQKQDNQTGKMSFEQLSELLFQKVDFSQPTLDRQFLEQMIYRIVPNTQDEFAWYLNLLPRQDSDLESFQKICTITVGFEEARQYRKSRKGMLRKNQWRDVTAHIYI